MGAHFTKSYVFALKYLLLQIQSQHQETCCQCWCLGFLVCTLLRDNFYLRRQSWKLKSTLNLVFRILHFRKQIFELYGRSISFLVIFESNVSFETVFGGLWEHSHISDSWKHSLYSERLLYVIQLHNLAVLTEQKLAFDETEASFWVTTHFGNHLHLFSEPTYPLFNT